MEVVQRMKGLAGFPSLWHARRVRDFQSLRAWHAAQDFVVEIYGATRAFPNDERFGLTQQLRRAATSIASNIAEGCGRDTDADLARFLSIATGSASECESQILTAQRLGFLAANDAIALGGQAASVRRQIHALRSAVRSD